MEVTEELGIGNGGWCRYDATDRLEPVFVRFDESEGRLIIVDLFLSATSGRGISANSLRQVPLGKVEAWANGEDLAPKIRSRLRVLAPDLRKYISYYSTTFGPAASNWVSESFKGNYAGRAQKPVLSRPPLLPAPLQVPESQPYGDGFYESVAAAYQALAAISSRPVADLAEQNGVKLSTVQKWVRVARARGHLHPAQHGKRG